MWINLWGRQYGDIHIDENSVILNLTHEWMKNLLFVLGYFGECFVVFDNLKLD